MVTCEKCRHWSDTSMFSEWDGHRVCNKHDGRFMVDGGDGSDSLYTKADFGCLDGKERSNAMYECSCEWHMYYGIWTHIIIDAGVVYIDGKKHV